jgi:TrpR-related protein YerC/YecD
MYMPTKATPHLDGLIRAFLSMKDSDECARFLEDLCTFAEIEAMAQRYHVAERLNAGDVYHTISAGSGVSTATISRVGRALRHGAGGYQIAFDRQKTEDKK